MNPKICDALFDYVNVFFDDERYCIVEWGGAIMIVFAPLIGDLKTVSTPPPPSPLFSTLLSVSVRYFKLSEQACNLENDQCPPILGSTLC